MDGSEIATSSESPTTSVTTDQTSNDSDSSTLTSTTVTRKLSSTDMSKFSESDQSVTVPSEAPESTKIASATLTADTASSKTVESTTMSIAVTAESEMSTETNGTEFANVTVDQSTTLDSPTVKGCVLDASNDCVVEGTTDECVPCDYSRCTLPNEECVNNSNCTASCQCANGYYRSTYTGQCIDLCRNNNCKNGGTCIPNAKNLGYTCRCPEAYDGELCDKVHNFCEEVAPRKCPVEHYTCQLLEGDYTCECIDGYTRITKDGVDHCVKRDQTLKCSLSFKGMEFSDAFNDFNSAEFYTISMNIKDTVKTLWPTELLNITFINFQNGSLIANFDVELLLPKNQKLDENEKKFRNYLLRCGENRNCFNQPDLVEILKLEVQDNRCEQVVCPETTECFASADLIKCVCKSGFSSSETIKKEFNRVVEVCEDVNECSSNSSTCLVNDEVCVNEIGSYKCLKNPCLENPCPGYSTCENVNFKEFKCKCSWIYSYPDCGFRKC
uniref:EGF-like domain-containing protein n=1 Tax=Syphacia muris TaxID=451379 RepID=A0A0N5AWN0_9BILA